MPLYKYRCTDCESTFKVLQRNGKKDEVPECPECGEKDDVERLISSVGLRFKGSGFYRTDYDGNSSYKDNGGQGNEDGKGDLSESKGESGVEDSGSSEA